MEFVQPIRDSKKIDAMKKILLAQSTRDHLLFVLGINGGLRISDILKLKVKDVVNEKNKPRTFLGSGYVIREQKTHKSRRLVFSKNVTKAIELFIKDHPGIDHEEYLFKSREGNKAITRQRAYQIINEAARSVGIQDKIGTHTLRKTFGYHAYKSGVDIAVIQQIFNHSAPSITLRYIGITQDDIDDVILNLNL